MAVELYPSPSLVSDPELSLGGSSAAEVLTDNIVEITKVVDLNVLRPYLIENRCITLAESRQLFKSASDSENVVQLIEVISKRGSVAFHGFLKALARYTAHESGEGALIDLLNKLREDVASKMPAEHTIITLQEVPPAPEPTAPPAPEVVADETDEESPEAQLAPNEQGPSNNGGRQDGATARHHIRIPGVSNFLILFLRFTGIAMVVLSVPLTIAGILILVMSFREFAGELECKGVGIKHSLSVFNFFFALLCFCCPALLLLFCLYFKFEDPQTRWRQKHRITRCVVWTQTIVFLMIFILIVFELLYSLLYIIPEIINNYNEWQATKRTNETICDEEIYLTSLSIVTVSYSTVFILLVVLGVFLASHYFKWISDEENPGIIINVIYVCLGRNHRQDIEHSSL